MKRAKSYAKNAQARSNTLGSFLLPAFLFPRAGLNNRWDQSREPMIHLEPWWVTDVDSESWEMRTTPPWTYSLNTHIYTVYIYTHPFFIYDFLCFSEDLNTDLRFVVRHNKCLELYACKHINNMVIFSRFAVGAFTLTYNCTPLSTNLRVRLMGMCLVLPLKLKSYLKIDPITQLA